MTELTYLDDPMLTEEREKKSIGSGEGEGDSETKAEGEGDEIEVVAETDQAAVEKRALTPY